MIHLPPKATRGQPFAAAVTRGGSAASGPEPGGEGGGMALQGRS